MKNSDMNIVLIGMPGSGKTTVGQLIGAMTGREFVDTDALAVEKRGKSIPEIFADDGELSFRETESLVIAEVCKKRNAVIATGGGTVLRSENVEMLKKHGRTYFLDRAPETLEPSVERPLAATEDAIVSLYAERHALYAAAADDIICENDAQSAAARIVRRHEE